MDWPVLLVLEVMDVVLIVGTLWSRMRYRGAYSEHYGIEVPRGWLWKRDPEPRIERLRYWHVAMSVGLLVGVGLLVQALFAPR